MPCTRRSRRSQAADLQIHEALVSGLSPEQVAGRFKQPLELVLAAEHRVLAERAKLGPTEALRQEHLEVLRITRKLALEAFQRATADEEVGTKSSLHTGKEGRYVEQTKRKKPPSASYLRMVCACVAQEQKLQAAAPENVAASAAASARPGGKSPPAAANTPQVEATPKEQETPPWLQPYPQSGGANPSWPIDTPEIPGPPASDSNTLSQNECYQRARRDHREFAEYEKALFAEAMRSRLPIPVDVDSRKRQDYYRAAREAHPDYPYFEKTMTEYMLGKECRWLDPKSEFYWEKVARETARNHP